MKLHAEMHQAPADEPDIHLKRLLAKCDAEAAEARVASRDVLAFVKRPYFSGLTAENRRKGRPPPQ